LRAEYEKLKNTVDVSEVSEEDEQALRIQFLDELEKSSIFSTDEFNRVLDQEFSVFKNGEKYSYVKDMKSAF